MKRHRLFREETGANYLKISNHYTNHIWKKYMKIQWEQLISLKHSFTRIIFENTVRYHYVPIVLVLNLIQERDQVTYVTYNYLIILS